MDKYKLNNEAICCSWKSYCKKIILKIMKEPLTLKLTALYLF
jgi:hypothetical protein